MRACRTAAALCLAAAGCAAPAGPGAPGAGPLQRQVEQAADEYGVPRPLLLALAWVESRASMNGGEPSVDGAYGLFHLVAGEAAADPRGRHRAQSLVLAARLTGLSAEALRTDPLANARGGAALLRAEMDALLARYPDLRDERLGDWFEAVMRASGVEDARLADGFASQVYRLLRDGLSAADGQGGVLRLLPQEFSLSGRAIWAELSQDLSGQYCPNGACVAFKPAANFWTGRSGNPITTVVIHDMEGYYASTIAYFQDPSTQASAHYCIRSSDGDVTQQVKHEDAAWHAGNGDVNRHSIGIEHEGFAAQGKTWFTEAMYRSSAALVRWLADTYAIPRDRAHIIGHYEVPDPNHAGWFGGASHHHDPCYTWAGDATWHNVKGCDWDWDHYMDLVNGTGGPAGTLTGFVGDACCGLTAGTRKPLVGAAVTLAGTALAATTDAQGFYSFSLSAGTYTPRASAAGYQPGDHTTLGSGYPAALAVSASSTTYGSILLTAGGSAPGKPVVAITSPGDGTSAARSPVTVTGTVDDQAVASVLVAGQPVATHGGAFSAEVALAAGQNTIVATATNAAGTGSATVHVSYAPPTTGAQGPEAGGCGSAGATGLEALLGLLAALLWRGRGRRAGAHPARARLALH